MMATSKYKSEFRGHRSSRSHIDVNSSFSDFTDFSAGKNKYKYGNNRINEVEEGEDEEFDSPMATNKPSLIESTANTSHNAHG